MPDPAHVQTSSDFGYTMFPGTCLSKAQEKKELETVVVELLNAGHGSKDKLEQIKAMLEA